MVILCTIDLETREVSLPAGQVIASYDHNVDVIRFQAEAIPGFSLDTSTIKIAAQGPNKARHDYSVDPSTVQIEEETGYITFDWPIPAGVTEMPEDMFGYGATGQLIFAVCAEIISGSTLSKAWHSDDGIITVVAHLEPESGGGEDPEEEATNAQKIAQLQTNVAVINTQVGALGNGSPKPARTVAEMTEHDKVYLYTGSETGYTAGNWYFWNGSAWTSGGTYGGAVTSTTFDKHGVPADDFAVGQALAGKADSSDVTALDTRVTAVEGDIDDINDRLTNDYIPVDGENLVTPQNIQGVGFTKTSQEIAGENIFSSDLLFEEDYYVDIDTNVNPPVITHGVYSGYKTYCVPVDGVSKYTFTSTRFACLAKGNQLASEAVGTLQPYATEITTTGASYLFLSYTPSTDFANIEIHKIIEQDAYTDFEMPEWSGIPALQNRVYELQYLNGVNLFDHAELIKENGYAIISNGKITFANSSGYNAYLIPVDGKSIYTFTSCRFAFLVDSDKESAIGSLLQNVVKVDSTGASYICFSFSTSAYPVADYSVVGDVRINTNKQPFAYVSGNLASGGNLQITEPKTNLRKGERIVFEGDITSFSSLKIGLSFSTAVDTESNQINTFLIDETNISYYAQPTNTPVVVAHGLTIANNIQIIWEMTAVASVKFTLISNGNIFEHEFTGFVRKTIGNPYVLSINTVMTDCKLSWTCTDINKKIWMFGDSYFAYGENRWTYYLHEYGYDNNCLLDGFPGEGSTNGRVAFNNLLQFGTPKFAVWCLGMNDGGDSDSAPSSDWETAKNNYFLNLCTKNNIVPIFATIPTVPSINNEQKNAWIRSSGYRYIDFAKAVGASASGVWYGDMLASDNVHPSASGARALFARVLLDLPEIMVDDF